MKRTKKAKTEYVVNYVDDSDQVYEIYSSLKSAEKRCDQLTKMNSVNSLVRLTYNALKDALADLFEQEHGNCDDNTCTMSKAFEEGFVNCAVDLWSRTGAPSDQFASLFCRLPKKRWRGEVSREFNKFDKQAESTICGECGSHIYHYEPNQKEFFCSDCGHHFETNDLRSIVARINKDKNEA